MFVFILPGPMVYTGVVKYNRRRQKRIASRKNGFLRLSSTFRSFVAEEVVHVTTGFEEKVKSYENPRLSAGQQRYRQSKSGPDGLCTARSLAAKRRVCLNAMRLASLAALHLRRPVAVRQMRFAAVRLMRLASFQPFQAELDAPGAAHILTRRRKSGKISLSAAENGGFLTKTAADGREELEIYVRTFETRRAAIFSPRTARNCRSPSRPAAPTPTPTAS